MPPIWTLLSYELVLATGTLRTTIRREVDGDAVTRHVDVSQPTGAGWTDTDACAAVAATLPSGHTVVADEAPAAVVVP